jgi:hypothetical protein
VAGIGFKGKGQRGRRRQQLPAAAVARRDQRYSSSELSTAAAYSRAKGVYQRACSNSKHKALAANDTLSRDSSRALRCRVCARQGSTYEQELYRILDRHRCVTAYAVEAHAVQGRVKCAGQWVVLGRQRWDVQLLQPARVLIAVQGEQHHSKLDTRRNSSSRCEAALAATIARDRAIAEGAIRQQFQVVWLLPVKSAGHSRRWTAAINTAMQAAAAGSKGSLHVA